MHTQAGLTRGEKGDRIQRASLSHTDCSFARSGQAPLGKWDGDAGSR